MTSTNVHDPIELGDKIDMLTLAVLLLLEERWRRIGYLSKRMLPIYDELCMEIYGRHAHEPD